MDIRECVMPRPQAWDVIVDDVRSKVTGVRPRRYLRRRNADCLIFCLKIGKVVQLRSRCCRYCVRKWRWRRGFARRCRKVGAGCIRNSTVVEANDGGNQIDKFERQVYWTIIPMVDLGFTRTRLRCSKSNVLVRKR